ncbi:MAG: serpin family protein [Desulfarculales bacterium]|jgi:serpin B|nr:serpin family protein [Desulfarculales bacterium]
MRNILAALLMLLIIFPAAQAGSASAKTAPPGPEALSQANNLFACRLYQQLAGQDGNLFFSPFSISSALAMVYDGAKGETALEMEKALNFPCRGQELTRALGGALERLNALRTQGGAALNIANSLWPQAGLNLRPDFLARMKQYYQVDMSAVDYAGNEAGARRTINAWVAGKTGERIQNLLSFPLAPDTLLLLVNAIYFKGGWLNPFAPGDSAEEDFYSRGEALKVRMMHKSGPCSYGKNEIMQILELPYAGKELSFLVILPRADNPAALAGLEKELSADNLRAWQDLLSYTPEAEISLPAFKLDWGTASLKEPLAALGMRNVFSGRADFSGLSEAENLNLDDVLHKAVLEVNEEGSEAAAATAAVMTRSARILSPPPRFRADRPFIFIIKENAGGGILFMGRLLRP